MDPGDRSTSATNRGGLHHFEPVPIGYDAHGVQRPHTPSARDPNTIWGLSHVLTRLVSMRMMTRVRTRETRLDNHPGARPVPWLSRGPFCPLEIRRFSQTRFPALTSPHHFNFGFGHSNYTVCRLPELLSC
ncbi:hypothetical protein CRG98_006700 [Punica granatum]|uniref:Uncharacterized protein n=1 Tax=Punica granatum TaxID=22663 RepID=A0A2I0KWR8_PUNGR|nr:hypothetical protein CRG98_006700 [Punica granatum]